MKKTFVISVATMCGMMSLCGCSGEVINDYEQQTEPTSVLRVFTRSGDAPTVAEDVPTPVSLYVFNGNGQCVKMLADVTQHALIPIAGGTYDVYAVAGADAARYDLPAAEEAGKTSAVSLKDGQKLNDLMTNHVTVTVADATEHNLTLTLTRAVVGVRQIVIKKVPTSVTGVSVAIAPLYQTMLLNGTYSGESGSYAAALTKGDDGTTWATTDAQAAADFFYPSVNNPTITVYFTTATGTTAYSYAVTEKLEANHRLAIEGTYTEQAKLVLSGTITGSEWGDDKAISFEFDETSSSGTTPSSGSETGGNTGGDAGNQTDEQTGGNSGGTSQTVILPAVGSVYKTCYVLAHVDDTHVLLLAPKSEKNVVGKSNSQTQVEASNNITKALSLWNVNGITSWMLPNRSQAELICSNYSDIEKQIGISIRSAGISGLHYLFSDSSINMFYTESGSMKIIDAFNPEAILLGVSIVEIDT